MSANINAEKPPCSYLNVSLWVCFYHINHLFYFTLPFLMAKWLGKGEFLNGFFPPSGGDAALGKHSALAP